MVLPTCAGRLSPTVEHHICGRYMTIYQIPQNIFEKLNKVQKSFMDTV